MSAFEHVNLMSLIQLNVYLFFNNFMLMSISRYVCDNIVQYDLLSSTKIFMVYLNYINSIE